MELQSPLTQQNRPDVFEPKIVGLYKQLFRDVDDHEQTPGFWRELFLLKPDTVRFRHILEDTDADYLIHVPHQTRQLLLEAIASVKAGNAPSDENALNTLTVFFSVILAKRYTNPSSDIIDVLAGLDKVDAVFTDLVATLETVIRAGRDASTQQKAVQTSIAVVAGGYQTALVSYFIHSDFFPALMKLVRIANDTQQAAQSFLLTGLLANFDKFDVHNQYRTHFAAFIDNESTHGVIESVGSISMQLRDGYIAVFDDTPIAWSIGGTLSYVGLGALAGTKPAPPVLTEEVQRSLFAELPGPQAATTLALYDFILANRTFGQSLISAAPSEKDLPSPFSGFLSYTSYLFQHAYRTSRASSYAYLATFILLILTEDSSSAKLLCETTAPVRLCRQRPPLLPMPTKPDRPYAAAIVDILIDGINHNLRKRLDVNFYSQSITVLIRVLTHLGKSRTKMAYHWPELWRSLLSFVRFSITYADDLKALLGTTELIRHLLDLLALALTTGESFLPDSASYDDLFYKLVESGEALTHLQTAFGLGKESAIDTLVGVSKHYRELIDEYHKGNSTNLSPREVNKIIKMGYETLSFEARQGLDAIEPFKESNWKANLKKVARVAVMDATALVG